MSFFEKWEAVIDNKDLNAMVELMYPEWPMVMHSTGKVVDLSDYKETIGRIVVSGKLIRNDVRCIYENDDIMVPHAIVTFPSGSTDTLTYVGMPKDGKLFWTETASTPLSK